MPTVYGDSFSLVSKKKSGSYGGNKQVVLRSKEGKENVPLRFPHQRTRLLFLSFFLFFFLFSNVFFFGSLVSSLPGLPTETSLLSFLKENMADDGVVLCRDEQSATADGADLSL